MSVKIAQFPTTVWDGLSSTRTDRQTNTKPSNADWDQLISEVLAVQQQQIDDREFTAINDSSAALVPGDVVYMVAADGKLKLADSDVAAAAALKIPVGMVKIGGADGVSVTVQFCGKLTLTLAQWDVVGTDANGLDPGAKYFLSGTPGEITTVIPNTVGDVLFVIGVAISATTLLVRLDDQGLDIA